MHNRSINNYYEKFEVHGLASWYEHYYQYPHPDNLRFSFPYARFDHCLYREGIFIAEDRVYPFTAGFVIYLPPGMECVGYSPTERISEWDQIYIDTDRLNLSLPDHEVVTYDTDVRNLLVMMKKEIFKKERANRDLYAAMANVLMLKICECAKPQTETGADQLQRRAILPAVRHIAENYAEELRVPELAALCNVSESTLKRYFNNVTGQSPQAYILTVRMSAAESFLCGTNMTVIEIAQSCGFDVLSTFNRHFLARYGMSPTAFRRQFQR